jgi:divalent metal cation (Fe/Co/Zn/Cd) transporter
VSATITITPELRQRAVHQAVRLNRLSLGYNALEAVVALTAGIAAGSIGLIGFGLDSVVEVAASSILAWRLAAERRVGCTLDTDRRATRAIAVSFAVLATYVGYEAITRLASSEHPDTSVVGIMLTTTSLLVMPFLARAKRRVAPLLGSRAQEAEAKQTSVCAWMSGFVLLGLVLDVTLSWWWADPVAALAIATIAAREAIQTWNADSLADTCCH